MTRSLTKELFTPFKRSLDFDLFSDQEEYSEEEAAKTMAKTMEQYMSKTRADYGSGVARRKIKDKDNFELKGQLGCEQCKGGRYSATALGFYQRNNVYPSYQERRKSKEDTLSKFMRASIKTLEIQIGQISKVLQKRGFGSLTSSTKTNPRDHVKSISTIVVADSYLIRRMGSYHTLMYKTKQTTIPFLRHLNGYYCEEKKESYGPQFLEAYSEASHINNSIPKKEKDPWSFTLPCFINNVCFDNALADLGASISVMPLSTYLNLGLGELAHTKLTKLRRDQVDDLMPTIKEGEVIEEFRARNNARMVSKVFGYPSHCDNDKKIRMDYAYNLKFSCMIVLEDIDAYRDEGMDNVIFGKPFLREVGINARRIDGIITIYNGNEEVTYQMDLAKSKEINNVSGESMIWKSESVGVLKLQDSCSTQILAHNSTWRIYRAKYQGSFSF
ncbi:hypothetical protein Tco_1029449 [Tanacetum coccineum]|uniref:Uncharacterized protein n=1 Tax=Tanacetum coccineum TaxID=301880 RepID=A0ABQ5G505_9ASTR